MRIPGFTRRKSSKHASEDIQPPQAGAPVQQPDNDSRTELSELGVLAVPRSSVDAGITTKRSIFRRGHSRSMSSNAQSKLDQIEPSRSVPATISAAGTSGGHPLRQQTLPQDLAPPKSKRPLLFAKRSASTAAAHSQPSTGSSATSVPGLPAGKTSPPYELAPLVTTPSDSFQLKSFRAASGVREDQPTLSSLVDAEYVYSPSSTRPNSPSPSPNPGQGSYFDNLPTAGQSAPAGSGTHERGYSSGSISVAKFREARAARSSSSLASADRSASTGLKLDLPPPLSMDYSRPVLASIQPVSRQYGQSSTASPASSHPVSAPAFTTAFAEAATPMLHPTFPGEVETLSSPVQAPRSPRIGSPDTALSTHPDNTLPLPPVPSDPRRSFQGHSRRTSTQSITSLSSAFGGWLNNTTSNLGIAFSVEDVQKAISTGTTALKNSIPASPNLNQLDKPFDSRILDEVQETLSLTHERPSKEELDALLGGKVLPPPPSQTDDGLLPPNLSRSRAASPQHELSRTSSLTNLSVMNGFSTAKNLFSSSIARVAKPARDDDDTASDLSVDLQATKPFASAMAASRHNTTKKTRLFGDSSSDEELSENEDSDDSDVERKRREKGRVFPPPRPLTQQEREQVYRTAQTPPTLSPKVSQSDLRHFGNHPIHPIPALPALTTKALTAFDDDEEENTPLSALRGKRAGAMSELGFSYRQAGPSRAFFQGSSASPLGQPTRGALGPAYGYSNPSSPVVHAPVPYLASASMTSLPLTSASMGHSLSAFSSTASDIAINPRQYQRSSSSQALPTATRGDPTKVSLSSLIAAEVDNDQKAGKAQMPGLTSLASSSSESSSIPKTPSDISVTAPLGKRSAGAPPGQAKQHRSTVSDFGVMSRPAGPRGPSSAISSSMRHSKTSSVPLVKLDEGQTAHDRMRERHRAEARQSGMLQLREASGSALPHQGVFASNSAPHVLQDFPPPPGVDAQLYASLPADQKQALQLRSQQMLAMMQGFAIQASNNTLAQPAQFGQPPFQSAFHPHMQMPMPMMGGQLPSMPSFSSFYGYPPMFPQQQLPPQTHHVQHPYVPQNSLSFPADGLPANGQ